MISCITEGVIQLQSRKIRTINADISRKNYGSTVAAIQGDGNDRCVHVQLLDNGVAWTPPAQTWAEVRYVKPDGTVGLYDTRADGRPAVFVRGSVATVFLVSQMLTVPGTVKASVVFLNSQLSQITTFPFNVTVEKAIFSEAQKSEDFIKLKWLEDQLDKYLKQAKDSGVFDGPKGDAFTYADFTPEQLAALIGPQGPQGDNTAAVEAAAAANAAAMLATDAAAAAQGVVDTVVPDVTQIKQNLAVLSTIAQFRVSRNILDRNRLIRGTIDYRGVINPSETADYYCMEYVPVNPGDYIHAVKQNYDGTQTSAEIQRISAYNSEQKFLQNYAKSKAFQIPDGVCYIQLQLNKTLFSTPGTMVAITDSADEPDFEYYYKPYVKVTNENTVVRIDARDGLDSFYEKMYNAFASGECYVYIGGGDIIYTNAFVEKIRSQGYRGVPIGGGCRYIFETGTRIICDYTGANTTDVNSYFTPLDSWNISSSYEIHNLDIVAKNTVYAIHDETNGHEKFCRHIYKDCNITLDNSAMGVSGNDISKCIGGGLGLHEEIIIENCVFHTINPAIEKVEDVSYHKANQRDYTDAKIVVTGCWFSGYFRCDTNYETIPDIVTRVIATGNSAKGISAYQCDAKIWGNEIRME